MSYRAGEETCYSSGHSIHAVECVWGWNYKVRRKAIVLAIFLGILGMAYSNGAVIAGLATKIWEHSPFRRVTLKIHSPGLVFTRPKVYPPSPIPSWSCCYHGRPTCHFAENFLVLFFSYFFESWTTFGFFSFFFFNDFLNSRNILPHFGKESLHIFKLTRGTRIDQKQFTCNVVEHVLDWGLLLQ